MNNSRIRQTILSLFTLLIGIAMVHTLFEHLRFPRPVEAVPGTLNINAGTSTNNNYFPGGVWTPSGNVGIGTTAPNGKLDVRITHADDAIIAGFGSGSTTPYQRFQFFDENDTTFLGPQLYFNSGYVGRIGGAGNLALLPTGNVGIGTTAPGNLLDVAGTMDSSKYADRANSNYFLSPAASTNSLLVAGNVGIGTTAPGQLLEVNGGSVFAHGASQGMGRIVMLLDSSDQFEWYPQSTGLFLYNRGINGGGGGDAGYKMSILNNGNVGIGTAGPGALLHLNSTGTTREIIDGAVAGQSGLAFNQAGTEKSVLYRPANSVDLRVYGDTLGADIMTWNTTSGNVGIGTTGPLGRLDVTTSAAGTTAINIAHTGATGTNYGVDLNITGAATKNVAYYAQATNASSNYSFWGNSGIMYNAGSVGIGTAGPGNTLEVVTSGSNAGITVNSNNASLNQAGLKLIAGNGATSRASRIDFLNAPASASTPRWTLINDYNQNGTNDLSLVNAAGTYSVLTVLQNGYVGIGTAGPGYKLDVAGNASVESGYVKMGNGYAVGTRSGSNYRIEAGSNSGCIVSILSTAGNNGWYCTIGVISFAVAFTATPYMSATAHETGTTGAAGSYVGVYSSSNTGFILQVTSFWNNRPTTPVDWIAYGPTTATNFDLAESYKTKDQTISSGDVVCVDPNNNSNIIKCQNPYDPTAIGIVSTNPGLIVGDDLQANSRLVGLQGRVPVKVTLENGPIKRGDPLTPSATKPGYAMKATKAGQIIGKALQPFDGNSTVLGENAFDGLTKNQIQKIINSTKATGEGQTMAFINISWYDPDVYLTSTGDLKIVGDNSGNFTLQHQDGSTIDRVGAFAEAIIAKLGVGLLDVQKLTIKGTPLDAYLTNFFSPQTQKINSFEQKVKQQQSKMDDLQKQIEQLKSIVCSDHPNATICVRANP